MPSHFLYLRSYRINVVDTGEHKILTLNVFDKKMYRQCLINDLMCQMREIFRVNENGMKDRREEREIIDPTLKKQNSSETTSHQVY